LPREESTSDVLKKEAGRFEVLEHVVKGVHVEGRGPRNHRVVRRPLDRINEAAPRTAKRKTARKKPEDT